MNKLISYSYDFVSYLMLQHKFNVLNIKKILLFGSVSRGDFVKNSDIDLFIDVSNEDDKQEKEIYKILDNFLNSKRINKWKLLGINNIINIIVGDLDLKKYEDLKISMEDNSIVLWQKFKEIKNKKSVDPHYIIKWNTKSNDPNQRVKISRFMYGYKTNKKIYQGFIDKTKSKQISNSVIIIKPNQINKIRKFFRDNNIKGNIKLIYKNN